MPHAPASCCPHPSLLVLRLHSRARCTPRPPLVKVLYEARDWKGLGEYVVLLSKRRGQLKQAVQAMVRQCMGYLPSTPDQVGRAACSQSADAYTREREKRKRWDG